MKPITCPNFNLIIWKREASRVVMSRLRCKQWSCPYCATKNREIWRYHLKKRIGRLGGRWWFITVTAPSWAQTKEASLERLRAGLDLLFKRIRRIWGKVEYVRVYEVHKTGAFHAHIIMSGLSSFLKRVPHGKQPDTFLPLDKREGSCWSLRTWLKKTCHAVKMGYMVDCTEVYGVQKVVNYVCKYITKEAQRFEVKGLRRIQTSKGIGAANGRDTGKGWNVGQHVWASDAGGLGLYDANLKLKINPSYWLNNVVYPPGEEITQ